METPMIIKKMKLALLHMLIMCGISWNLFGAQSCNIALNEAVLLKDMQAIKNQVEVSKLQGTIAQDINYIFPDTQMSLLANVMSNNDLLSAEILLQNGAIFADNEGINWLYDACMENQVELIRLLMDCNVPVNSGADNNNKNTLLWWACKHDNEQLVNYVIAHDQDIQKTINKADESDNSTPLWWACLNNKLELAKKLIENGANINATQVNGKPLLLLAYAKKNTELALLLIEKGADIHRKDLYASTLLLFAFQNKDMALVTALVERGVDVNYSCKDGRTALWLACFNNDIAMTTLLLEKGVNDINCKGLDDTTPLCLACNNSNLLLAELLIAAGADINCIDAKGRTALWLACSRNSIALATLLLEKGADVNCVHNNGNTALALALYNKNEQLVHLLLNHPKITRDTINTADKECNRTPLWWACFNNDRALVKKLFEKGVTDINCKGLENRTPLWLACYNNNLTLATLLIEKNADINCTHVDGRTVLWEACQHKNEELAYLLLRHKNITTETINVADKQFHRTALWLACFNNNLKLAASLIAKDADINSEHIDGGTPLWLACNNNNVKLAELLISKNADLYSIVNNISIFELLLRKKLVDFKKFAAIGMKFDIANRSDFHSLLFNCPWNKADIYEFLIAIFNVHSFGFNDADCLALVNAKNKEGVPLLLFVLKKLSEEKLEAQKVILWKCIKVLVQKGADVQIKDEENATLLHHAVIFNVPEFISEYGAIEDNVNKSGRKSSPFKINLDDINNVGLTAFELAVKLNRVKCVGVFGYQYCGEHKDVFEKHKSTLSKEMKAVLQDFNKVYEWATTLPSQGDGKSKNKKQNKAVDTSSMLSVQEPVVQINDALIQPDTCAMSCAKSQKSAQFHSLAVSVAASKVINTKTEKSDENYGVQSFNYKNNDAEFNKNIEQVMTALKNTDIETTQTLKKWKKNPKEALDGYLYDPKKEEIVKHYGQQLIVDAHQNVPTVIDYYAVVGNDDAKGKESITIEGFLVTWDSLKKKYIAEPKCYDYCWHFNEKKQKQEIYHRNVLPRARGVQKLDQEILDYIEKEKTEDWGGADAIDGWYWQTCGKYHLFMKQGEPTHVLKMTKKLIESQKKSVSAVLASKSSPSGLKPHYNNGNIVLRNDFFAQDDEDDEEVLDFGCKENEMDGL